LPPVVIVQQQGLELKKYQQSNEVKVFDPAVLVIYPEPF
jgi:hypothetical protein